MCVDKIIRTFKAEHNILAYKIVSNSSMGQLKSWIEPCDRRREKNVPDNGTSKDYTIDTISTSDAPGMYCFANLHSAKDRAYREKQYRDPVVIAVVIPAGTEITEAMEAYDVILLTPSLIPLRIL